MKKLTLLPVLALATISLNGMSRLAQATRQTLPALRQATRPGTCPAGLRPVVQRGLFTTSRTGAYAGGQQAAFGRGALLVGGAGAAALATKAAYDSRGQRILERAYAAEELSREEILAQRGQDAVREAQELAPIQFALDLRQKATREGSLSEEEKTQLLKALPLILSHGSVSSDTHLFFGNRYSRVGHMQDLVNGSYLVLHILKIINLEDTAKEQFMNSILDTTIGTVQPFGPSRHNASIFLYDVFDTFPATRLSILDKTIAAYDTHRRDTGNLLYRFTEKIADIFHTVGIDRETKQFTHNDMPLTILKHFAQQEKGAGKLLSYILSPNLTMSPFRQKQSWLLARQVIQHPELTSALAATYNNPAPEFDSFRNFVNQTDISYTKGSPEDEALYAIKREALRQAKAGTTSRVQE